ncbi:MAG: LysM peptidoglycan-binding domain-containing protein [Chloroflexales bacterium]|nr:LysM peptidoglycan-binding domain-containing protein [Chloroflexales bacterium]
MFLHSARIRQALAAVCLLVTLAACAPEPPQSVLPTLPAVLDITPAPTLDVDATATAFASLALPTPTAAALYTVQAGDTLSALAERFATSVDELVAANGMTDPNDLQPGQTLIIPSLLRTPLAATGAPLAGTPTPLSSPTPTLSTP